MHNFPVSVALFSFLAITAAQEVPITTIGELPEEGLTQTCRDGADNLESSEDFLQARSNFWVNNGLCFRILENFGGEVLCRQTRDAYRDECESLHESSSIGGEGLSFCRITTVATLSNVTFDDGSQNFTFTFDACMPTRCSSQASDIEAYVLSFLVGELQNGDLAVDYKCTEFVDLLGSFLKENQRILIIVGCIVAALCFCCIVLWWCRSRRKEEKDIVVLHDGYTDRMELHGPNAAPLPPPQDSVAQTEDQYEDEETSSEEEELEEDEELSEDSDDSETSSYRAPDESQMGDYPDDDQHPEVTVDAAMHGGQHHPVAAVAS